MFSYRGSHIIVNAAYVLLSVSVNVIGVSIMDKMLLTLIAAYLSAIPKQGLAYSLSIAFQL